MTTQGRAGAAQRWRDVDGIVLLDKPTGLSSNHALQRIRRCLQAAKGGHAGTLDPLATGMLPLCFGQATKACGQLLGSRKAYRARLRLGAATDTGDSEGRVIAEAPVAALDVARVDAVLAGLVGVRQQVPPMYSALKRDGRPLYEIARQGGEVERAPREVRIESLARLALESAALEFEVVCSKGTYVRVLGEEIAAGLGTRGHLGALRRLWVEPFASDVMATVEQVEAWVGQGGWEAGDPPGLLPVDAAFRALPRLDLDRQQGLHLCQGRALEVGSRAGEAELWRVYDADGRFLGLVNRGADGRIRVQRLFVPGAQGAQDPEQT